MDDDNFIDDSGVDPTDRYGSDNEARSPGDHPEVSGLSHSFFCVWYLLHNNVLGLILLLSLSVTISGLNLYIYLAVMFEIL